MIVLKPAQLYTRLCLGALVSFVAGIIIFCVLAGSVVIVARDAGNAIISEQLRKSK